MDQDALIGRCRQGERQAQRILFEQTSGEVYRLLLRLTGSHDNAFDLTQETYLKAFVGLADFDGRSSLKTWLIRIAVNEALQLQRRSRLFKRKIEHVALRMTEKCEPASAAACRMDVQDALSGLEPADRAVLLLRYQEGLDYAAIAEATGVPKGTVASRLNRARRRLRAMLNEGYGREEETSPVHLIGRREHEVA